MRVEILKETGPTTLTKRWFEDGTVVEPTDAVTFDLIGSDGGSVRTGAATKAGTGTSTTYTVAVTVAEAAAVEEYTLGWTRADTGAKLTDDVGIVGTVLFTEAEARAFNVIGGINPLSDATAYTDVAIAEARYRIGELLERRLGASLVRRFARIRVKGQGRDELALFGALSTHGGPGYDRRPLAVLSASVNGTALTAGELGFVEVDGLRNVLTRYDGNSWSRATGNQPPRNIVVGYEYGHAAPPWESNRVGLLLLLRSLVPSDVSSRATSFSNEDGTFRLSTPSLMHPTGIPEVDEFIVAYDERPLFG